MKRFNRKRLKLSLVLFLLVGALMIFMSMDVMTLSRYESHATSENSLATAMYLVNDTYDTINVVLPDIIPGNNQYEYKFSVSNYRGTDHSDTNLKYRIHIRTTTNLDIEYDLFNTWDIEEAETCVANQEVVQDIYSTPSSLPPSAPSARFYWLPWRRLCFQRKGFPEADLPSGL